MNRINELDEYIPSARKGIDQLINELASWRNSFTIEDEAELILELSKMSDKWGDKFRERMNYSNN